MTFVAMINNKMGMIEQLVESPVKTLFCLREDVKNMNTDQLKVWHGISNHPVNYYVTASESEREAWREWVRGVLKERTVTVDFEKATGEHRSMKCTLKQDLGAKYTVTENTCPKKPNPDVCVVWDIAQQAWRSFRWDRVTRIQFDLG